MCAVKNWLKLGQFPFACKFLKQIPTIQKKVDLSIYYMKKVITV